MIILIKLGVGETLHLFFNQTSKTKVKNLTQKLSVYLTLFFINCMIKKKVKEGKF